jgi:hypothetical protein
MGHYMEDTPTVCAYGDLKGGRHLHGLMYV